MTLLILLTAYFVTVGYLCFGVSFHYRYSRPVAWLLNKMNMAFICIGGICFKDVPWRIANFQQDAHERRHFHQWRVWGPLFPPVYLLLLAIYGYNKHPMENDARRHAGQPTR